MQQTATSGYTIRDRPDRPSQSLLHLNEHRAVRSGSYPITVEPVLLIRPSYAPHLPSRETRCTADFLQILPCSDGRDACRDIRWHIFQKASCSSNVHTRYALHQRSTTWMTHNLSGYAL